MIKNIIHRIFNEKGYSIIRTPSVELDIELGKYKWLQEYGIQTIIDVGANIGQFSNKISKILPNANIFAFEPLNNCYTELLSNVKHNTNIECFNFALGKEEGIFDMYSNDFSPSSSLLKMDKTHVDLFPQTSETSIEQINVKTLDSFLNTIKINRKVLLKIDVQGYELNVLKGAEEILNQVDIIILESSFMPLYENQPLFHEIYSYLFAKDFRYNGRFDQLLSPKNGISIQEDSIFIRNLK